MLEAHAEREGSVVLVDIAAEQAAFVVGRKGDAVAELPGDPSSKAEETAAVVQAVTVGGAPDGSDGGIAIVVLVSVSHAEVGSDVACHSLERRGNLVTDDSSVGLEVLLTEVEASCSGTLLVVAIDLDSKQTESRFENRRRNKL